VSGGGTKYIVTELVVEQTTISSAGELNSGGGRMIGFNKFNYINKII
jgi:hypothetical protein